MYTKVYHKLKELNLFAKMIGLILMILSVLFVENIYLVFGLIILSIILSGALKSFRALQLSITLIVIFMFYYLHPFLLFAVKLVLLYVFYLIVKSMTNSKEKRYVIDKLFYSNKSKASMKIYLESCFKSKKFKKSMEPYDNIDKLTRRKYSKYIIEQAEKKTNYDLQDVYYRHKLSFYKMYNKKTTILDMKWNGWDNLFLGFTTVLFILVLFYR